MATSELLRSLLVVTFCHNLTMKGNRYALYHQLGYDLDRKPQDLY